MEYKICMSIAEIDPSFAKMAEELKKVAEVDVMGLDGFSLAGYDIFIGKKMTTKMLETADRLKVIFAYKTGVDDFPLEELEKREIQVVNSHADSVFIAQYAFGLAISLSNRITEFDKKFRRGIWYDHESPYWKSFFEMKVGLLGYGHIGREIHRILRNNSIEAYTLNRGKFYEDIHAVDTLEELCDSVDMLILSLPKTKETDVLIDQKILEHLEGKYIVNVGRSNCIDQTALYKALKAKKIAGAAIDTWDKKPGKFEKNFYPTKLPFKNLDNIVLSPHQAMKVNVGHDRYVMDTLKKVLCYMQTGELSDKVDLQKGY